MSDAVYSKVPKIVSRRIEDEFVLVPIRKVVKDGDCLYSLNGMGGFIWEKLDGRAPLSEIARAISRETGKPEEEVQKDAEDFIRDMEKEGLVVRS